MAVTIEQILEALDSLQRTLTSAIAAAKLSPKQITIINGLSDINNSLGTIRAGLFLALSSGDDPTDSDGTGTFISALGKTFGSNLYHIGGVENGDLKWGANAVTGELEAGDGAVRLTEVGVSVYDSGTEIARLGDLYGFLGETAHTLGFAIGDSARYMIYDQTNGLEIKGALVSDREILTANRTYYVRTTPVEVTISIATPAVVTLASHGLSIGDAVIFKTTGALPTGITEGETYYVITEGFAAGEFEISDTLDGSAINTSGSQSGTQKIQTGSDDNDGLTTSTPFLTIHQALVTIATKVDMRNYFVTIQVADGLYLLTDTQTLSSCVGTTSVTIWGNLTNPENVILRTSAATYIFSANGCSTSYSIRGFQYESTHSPYSSAAIMAAKGSKLYFGTSIFGSGFSTQVFSTEGGFVQATYSYSITAGANYHLQVSKQGQANISDKTITITGTPDFATAFVYAYNLGYIDSSGITFTGSATGKRYSVQLNGVIYTANAGATYFPGDVAGSTALGGEYY